ncbi:MAG: 3-phosphoshikimate 1-carboxyvinyltransferase [Acidobacteria bacterium]|nr:3-phosphoshikimate 1-carboxyvinyltransferase [Candidatus Sulfomarinibacter sp. MAG AM1]
MSATLLPGPRTGLHGSVELPPSKSLTNRAMIAAAAAGGGAIVSPLDCDDTRVLAAALAAAGWPVVWREGIEIGTRVVPAGRARLGLSDSGTGARLILGLLAVCPGLTIVDGSARLRERPMAPLLETLNGLGARLRSTDGGLPIEIDGGKLKGGGATIRPEVSSQFVSSLVLAAPLMERGLDLQVLGPLPSAPYLDLSEDVLRAFGGELEVASDRRRWRVAPGPLQRTRYAVEGDWSAAAFVLAAVAVAGGSVELGPLDPASRQGDRVLLDILERSCLDTSWEDDHLFARGPVRSPIEADLTDTPDLFPALAVVAAAGVPGSCLVGLDNLRHKESDRLTEMVENLRRLGAEISIEGSRATFERPFGRRFLQPPRVTAAGDHRIAMAMAVAALASGPLDLDEADSVSKSFPGFWRMWERLTGVGAGGA